MSGERSNVGSPEKRLLERLRHAQRGLKKSCTEMGLNLGEFIWTGDIGLSPKREHTVEEYDLYISELYHQLWDVYDKLERYEGDEEDA